MDFDTSEIDTLSSPDLVSLFNDFLYDLLKQLNTIIKNDSDITYFYSMYKDVIKMNQALVIDQFNVHVLQFYDHIKAKDEAFFMKENDAIKKYEGTSAITKIFKFKTLFQQLGKKDKDMLFYYLNILCYIGARYFTLANK